MSQRTNTSYNEENSNQDRHLSGTKEKQSPWPRTEKEVEALEHKVNRIDRNVAQLLEFLEPKDQPVGREKKD